MKVPLLSIESVPTRLLFLYPTKVRIPSLSIEVERKCHSTGSTSPEGIGTDHEITSEIAKSLEIDLASCFSCAKDAVHKNRARILTINFIL